jgi:hypothetical protein
MIRSLVATMSLAAFARGAVPEEAQTGAAKLFESYVALEAAFDPAVADLYSDAAKSRIQGITLMDAHEFFMEPGPAPGGGASKGRTRA